MFSGLVSNDAHIVKIDKNDKVITMTVKTHPEGLTDVKVGDSIAVNGCCLTVEAFTSDSFTVTMMPQTWDKTTFKKAQVGDQVNIERSIALGKRFEGHIVLGHVDETVKVIDRKQNENAIELWFERPERLKNQLVSQGSVALNGTSLTIMRTEAAAFSVGLIPHTQEESNLGKLKIGDDVNLETDVIAKYVEANMKRLNGVD